MAKHGEHIETGTENNLHDLFINNGTGWIVGDWGTVLKTTDGGQTFAQIDGQVFGRKSLKGVHFVDENRGWIVTYSTPTSETKLEKAGYIYRTTDGGETWEVQFVTEAALFNLHFIDKQTGLGCGVTDGASFVTTDGGEHMGLRHSWNEMNAIKVATVNRIISAMNRCIPLHFTILTL